MIKIKQAMDKYLLRSLLFVGSFLLAVLFYHFVPANGPGEGEFRIVKEKTDPGFLYSPQHWIDSVMASLTPEQRIAQMIMVAAYSNYNQQNENEVARLIRNYSIGGLVFFQGYPHRQAELTNYYQSISTTPLFVAMDAEWGLAMRLDSTIRYPRQMALGAVENDRLIFDMACQVAKQLKRLGVHINFAPVVDINSNPENPVISSRSFGEDRTLVTRKSLFYMYGLENNGILAVAKHFPGHGDSDADSHVELPLINYDRGRLDSLELFPFKELIYNGLSGILTAHIRIPALDDRKMIPASLSELVIDSLLRKELGFKGLIFTDALGMKGITDHYKPAESAEKAILAGNDILLMPGDVDAVIKHILKQTERGRISPDEIDQHCRRILAAKYWSGLNKYKPVELKNLYGDLNKPEYSLLQRQLISSSITVLENHSKMLPLRHLDTLKVASVVFSNEEETVFQQTLGLYMPVSCYHFRGDGSDHVDSLFTSLRKYNLVIASLHSNDIRPANGFGIPNQMIALIDSLSGHQQVILSIFSNPYLLNRFDHPDRLQSLILAYENAGTVQELTAQVIFGALDAKGLLPVSVKHWPALTPGIQVNGLGRLRYSIPFEAGMSADTLNRIESIIANAIDQQAIPGCQVLVARKGIVVFQKAFGTQRYGEKTPVHLDDLYDLASVTKVAATTQALMRLVDEGCTDINQKLSAYLAYLDTTNKKDILIRDVLMHRAGLMPFIAFDMETLEPVFSRQSLYSQRLSERHPFKIGPGRYLNKYTRFKEGIMSTSCSASYPLKVADNLYLNRHWIDTIYTGIARSPLKEGNEYVYSDLGLMLIKQLIDTVTGIPFTIYLDSVFYRKLGADHLCFNPLERYARDRIAPTEDDQLFRKQQIQGYVHDPRAAMLGGVSGHAGLFGNANDLAKLFQMLLRKGEYGGERYISKETIAQFTGIQPEIANNRRGLGFDKPESDTTKTSPACRAASPESFGHTGFTGTMVWADPVYDLIYVFLSNRVYPDAMENKLLEMNVRTDVQQVIYNAITDKYDR
jgi:beta-glucosidase-like glycosyl hydrolase/CubicO group peptidase (beta-lactamase class C family)